MIKYLILIREKRLNFIKDMSKDILDHQDFVESSISEEKLEELKNSLFFNMFPPLIKELVEQKLPVEVKMEESAFFVQDFYSSKVLKLEVIDKDLNLQAVDKKGNKVLVKSVDDIVKLNFDWWVGSKTKDAFPALTKSWAKQFLQRKWVKKQWILVPDFERYEEDTGIKHNISESERNHIEESEEQKLLEENKIESQQSQQSVVEEKDPETLAIEAMLRGDGDN